MKESRISLGTAFDGRWLIERNRSGYYSTFIVMCVLDIVQTAIRGELLHPIWYVPFVGHYTLVAGAGRFFCSTASTAPHLLARTLLHVF